MSLSYSQWCYRFNFEGVQQYQAPALLQATANGSLLWVQHTPGSLSKRWVSCSTATGQTLSQDTRDNRALVISRGPPRQQLTELYPQLTLMILRGSCACCACRAAMTLRLIPA